MTDSKTETKKAPADKSRHLDAATIFRGGDSGFEELEIPSVMVGGEAGVVFLKHLPAGDVMEYVSLAGGRDAASEDVQGALLALVAKAVVQEDGTPTFTEAQTERLKEISMATFNTLSDRVLKMAGIRIVVKGQEDKDDGAEDAGNA